MRLSLEARRYTSAFPRTLRENYSYNKLSIGKVGEVDCYVIYTDLILIHHKNQIICVHKVLPLQNADDADCYDLRRSDLTSKYTKGRKEHEVMGKRDQIIIHHTKSAISACIMCCHCGTGMTRVYDLRRSDLTTKHEGHKVRT